MPPPDEIVVEIDAIPPSVSPPRVFDLTGELITRPTLEPLADEGPDGSLRGGAAEALEPRDGGRAWRVRLRPDLRWSDGRAATSDDVVRAVELLTRPDSGAPLAWLADGIQGVVERRAGSPSARLGCSQIDKRTVEFCLRRPRMNFPQVLSASVFSPRPPDRQDSGAPPVLGPYALRGCLPQERGYVLERNRASGRATSNSPARVIFLRTDSPEQGIRLFEAGRLHLTSGTTFPASQLARFRGSPSFFQRDLAMVGQLCPNPRVFGANTALIRRAISLAVDRHAIASALGNTVHPLWRYTALWDSRTDDPPRRRPDAARHALPRPLRPEVIRLAYADFPPNRAVLSMVARDIEDALGVHVRLKPADYERHVAQIRSGDFEMVYTLNPAPYPDASSLLVPFAAGGVLARATRYSDQSFDALLASAEEESDPAARATGFVRANDRFLKGLPVIPLLRCTTTLLRDPQLTGVVPGWNGTIGFEATCVEGAST